MVGSSEKELYRIFKAVEKYGRTTFSYPDKCKQQGMARKIGKRVAPLVKKGLMNPPLSSTNKHKMTGVQLPINVKIVEKKMSNGSYFIFQWK